MRIFVDPTRKKTVQLRTAALVLLAVALVIPQLTWADHASDHPYSQFDDPTIVSPNEAYAALVEKYKTGELVFHAPGRRDDRPSSASADSEQTGAAFLAANPGVMASRRYVASQQEVAAAASSARWVALGSYYTASQQEVAAAASSARWAALGSYYTASQQDVAAAASSARWAALGSYYAATNAAFLAANPEIMASRRFVQDGCSELGQVC